MATRYLRSSGGSDADNGTTWALAKATITGIAAIDTAGDVIWVSQAHAETTAAAISFDWASNYAGPVRVVCGDDAAEPPTAMATTGSITTTGNSNITISAGADYLYFYGINFIPGSGATGTASVSFGASGGRYVCESCVFNLASTGTSSRITICSGTINQNVVELVNCSLQFSATAQKVTNTGGGVLTIRGGSILSDAAITEFMETDNNARAYIEGFDFSNAAAAMNITSATDSGIVVLVRNCKMPASWSGSINSGLPGVGSVFELHNSDSADTNYRYERKVRDGTITGETTIVLTGGASDGTTPISWKMVSSADTEWKHQTLDSGEIVRWNETTASAITVTVEVIHSGVGSGGSGDFTDKELWLEVQYLGTSGTPLSLFVSDAAASYIAAAADQDNSTATWTSEPATPVKQKLSVTFTPQEKGYIHAVVKLAAASKTVYVDPKLTVS